MENIYVVPVTIFFYTLIYLAWHEIISLDLLYTFHKVETEMLYITHLVAANLFLLNFLG